MKTKKRVLVVLGPTATGKSALAVLLAKRFGGEIISADSRQVYKGLDIGTGKITKKEMAGIPHHLLDVASPSRVFTVAHYKKLTEKTLKKIWTKEKIPILCGGTGFYIRAVVDNIVLPEVPPNKKLRDQLEKKTIEELFVILKKLDARRAENIDRKNPRRLVRAIEIAKHLGKVPRLEAKLPSDMEILQIGIDMPNKMLKMRIKRRLDARMKQGMVAEAKRLRLAGLSSRRMEALGLEYRYLARYLQSKISKARMISELENEIWQYAKRQRTWFKKDKRIVWFKPHERKKIERLVEKFL